MIETEAIILRLEERNIKPTANRILVCQALANANRPLSMADLEFKIVTLDKSTLSRSLNLFLSHDLVHAIEDGSGSMKYELCQGEHKHSLHDNHPHFHCTQCNQTFCLDEISVPTVDLPEGFVTHDINYVVKGTCPQCAKKLSRNKL